VLSAFPFIAYIQLTIQLQSSPNFITHTYRQRSDREEMIQGRQKSGLLIDEHGNLVNSINTEPPNEVKGFAPTLIGGLTLILILKRRTG